MSWSLHASPRNFGAALVAAALFFVSPARSWAEAKPAARGASEAKAPAPSKEVTLEGEMMCARCNLHETKSCRSVLKVKDVKYYFTDNAVARENVEKVCGGGSKHAIVTGVVSEQDGKKQITPSAVKLP